MALMMLAAAVLLAPVELIYSLCVAGISLLALTGSFFITVLAWRLNYARCRKAAGVCFLQGAMFLALAYLFSAFLAAVCSGLFIVAGTGCLFFREPVKEKEADAPV